jgi:hypothetical protein
MDGLDSFLQSVAYKFPKGYPDINNEEDKKRLFEMVSLLTEEEPEKKEGPTKKELIDLINNSELPPKTLLRLFKITQGGTKIDTLKNYLTQRGYTSDSFKNGKADIERILNVLTGSEAEEFVNYIQGNRIKLSDLPDSGNFKTSLKEKANLSPQLIDDLIQIVGVDKSGSNIGKVELFLALIFSDVINREGGGDLNWDGVGNLEVKGTGGRAGQQGQRGPFINGQNLIADKFIPMGEQREEFESSDENRYMNYCLKNAFDFVTKDKGDIKEFIAFTQKLMDEVFFNMGLAEKYFNNPSDFEDLAEMRNKIFKLNLESYAKKTNVDAFMFVKSGTSDYAIVNIDKVDDAVDEGIIMVRVSPVLGYKWDDPNPNLHLGKKRKK